jgi:fructose-1,6-bisphosphatase/inositol monophosphatase family enzyme
VKQFQKILDTIVAAGDLAALHQGSVVRSFKPDGSVLTETDLEVNRMLTEAIEAHFPDANIVSEEHSGTFIPGKEWTFAVDPIDGTDAYSQGMPGWCVAVGILDQHLEPVGGIIYAPRWGFDSSCGMLLSALPGEPVLYNGKPLGDQKKDEDQCLQLMISSKLHRKFDLSAYPGKVRSLGSTILHIVAPLIHPGVTGALLAPCFIWDIAAAHGIVSRKNISVSYLSGEKINYSVLVHRQKATGHILAGNSEAAAAIKSCFLPSLSYGKQDK